MPIVLRRNQNGLYLWTKSITYKPLISPTYVRLDAISNDEDTQLENKNPRFILVRLNLNSFKNRYKRLYTNIYRLSRIMDGVGIYAVFPL